MTQGRQSILLVEDNPSDILLLERVFKRAKLRDALRVVSTGEEALAYLNGDGLFSDRQLHPFPSMVFLDLNLPGISGFEVLSWIRQRTHLKRIHIVVLTGSRHTIDIYRAYEMGANSYLVKPVGVEALHGVAELLNLRSLKTLKASPQKPAVEAAQPSVS